MLAGKSTPDPGGNGAICRCVTNHLPEAATGASAAQPARSEVPREMLPKFSSVRPGGAGWETPLAR